MEAETRKPAAAPRRRAQRAVKHAHGLTVLEDISAITARSEDLQETLQRVVEVVAERVGTDVCSLYILDPRAQRLTLWATVGLDRNSIGKVTMSVEEGLTGMAIEKLEPVMAVDAITQPRYKFFPETGEEKYHSFLGVPIIERGTPIGVLVVQTLRRRKFSAHEIRILREIASKVGPIIVTARLMEDLKSKENERREFRRRMVAAIKRLQAYEKTADRAEAAAPGRGRARLNGLPAAPGFGRGQAHLLDRAVDVKDVGLRILRNLLGVAEPERPLAKDSVLVADELTLSDLALIEHEHLCGIVLATGGVTSHASILAKSFEIPTVVGCEHLIETVQEGDDLIVDGNSGVVYVNPPVDVAREYERLERDYSAFNQKLETLKQLPAETSDGRRLSLYANLGLIADLLPAHRHGAQGVGPYRTEFPC